MPPACWFLVLFWVWWLPSMLVLAEEQKRWEGCPDSRCGNLTISQPFWMTDRQTGRSCGPLDFKVDCSNNTPSLRSSGIYGFASLDIAYDNRSLRAVDLHKVELLQDPNGCHAPSWNTSEKLGLPFKVDPVNLDLVLYNCAEAAAVAVAAARRNGALVKTRMRCGKESEVFVRIEETSLYSIEGCDACLVPVMGTNGEANARDYEELIRDGFLRRWDLPPRKFARQIVAGGCSPQPAGQWGTCSLHS